MTKTNKGLLLKFIVLAFALIVSVFMLTAVIASAQTEDFPTISCGTEEQIYFDGIDTTEKIFTFTPTEDGTYCFYSYNSDEDTYGYILSETGDVLTYDDDSGEDSNFKIDAELTKDTVYFLKVRFYSTENEGATHVKIEKAIPPTSIEITTEDPLSITEGESYQLAIKYHPENALETPIEWASSDPEIAYVDAYGYLKILAPGTATVSATSGDLSDSITVNASSATAITEDQSVTVSFIESVRTILSFVPEEDGWYAFYTENAKIKNYANLLDDTLSSIYYDEETELGFFLQGYLTAEKTYYIVIASDYHPIDETVDVFAKKISPATSISLNYSEYNGYLGEQLLVAPSFSPDISIRENFVIESSNEEVVYIDTNNFAHFAGIGTATVTVTTDSGLTASCDFTVSDPRTISRCQTLPLDLTSSNGKFARILFIPTESGKYLFYSNSDGDPYAYLYEGSDYALEIGSNDDNDSDHDFAIYADLTLDTVYFLTVHLNGSKDLSLDLSVVLADENGNPIHEIDGYTYTKEGHSFDCSVCGIPKTEPHTYDDSFKCFCGYTHLHEVDGDWRYEAEYHSGECQVCGRYVEEQAHAFDENGECACGYFLHEHEYPYFYIEDEHTHYGYCDICDLYGEYEHSLNEEGECECSFFLHDHKYTKWYKNEHEHYSNCDLCGNYESKEHTFGTDNACLTCGYYEHEHIAYFWQSDGEYYHSSYCAFCDTHLSAVHKIGDTGYCVCGYHEHEHISDSWNISETYHWGTCYICSAYIDEDHSYTADSPCKCGYYEHEHLLKEYEVYGSTHDGVCEICTAEVSIEHEFNTEGVCVCGYDGHTHDYGLWKYDEYGHIAYCSMCDEEKSDRHVFENNGKCVCGYYEHEHTVSTYSFDTYTHWGYCSICRLFDSAHHKLSENNACVCGYYKHEHERTEIKIAGTMHYYFCTICTAYIYEDHEIGADGKCVCGYYEHQHSFTEYDKDYHYADCNICRESVSEPHKFLLGKCACGYEDHLHSFTEYVYTYNGHSLRCSECKALVSCGNSEPHFYGSDGKCVVCNYKPLDVVYVGGVILENGKYIDTSGTVTDTAPSGGYAHLKDGVLTLSNFTLIIKEEKEYDEPIFTTMDIEIVLVGKNKLHSEFDDAIFVYADLKISGSGSIELYSGTSDGIDVLGKLTVNGGTLYVNADDNAIESDGEVTVNGGILRLSADDDGLNAYADVTVNDGVIYVTSEDEGLDIEEHSLTVNGGSIYVYSETSVGVWVGKKLYINGGYLYTETKYEGIYVSEGKAYLNGGRIKASVKTENYPALLTYHNIITSDSVGKYDVVFAMDGSFTLAKDGNILTGLDHSFDGADTGKLIGSVTAESEISYTGSSITPKITVTDQNGKLLTEGVDYAIVLPFDGILSIGSYDITVAGIGNYRGIKTITLSVTEPTSPTPDPEPPVDDGFPVWAIIAISAGGIAVLVCGTFLLYRFVIRKKKTSDIESPEDNAQ